MEANNQDINPINQEVIKPTSKKRIFELDFLRGLAVIMMILDHFTYLLSTSIGYEGWASYIFKNALEINNPFINSLIDFSIEFQNSALRLGGHYFFVSLFFFLAGISCTFSHSNFKRSIKIIGGGLIITSVTVVASLIMKEDLYIIFGVLSTLGVSILIFAIVKRYFDNKWLYLAIGLVIIIWGFLIKWYAAERYYYITELNLWRFIQVILGYKVYGLDHFGLIPCTGVLFLGAWFGKMVYAKQTTLLPKLDKGWHKPISFVGRHALWFYLLHQVGAALIIGLLFLLCGYHF